MMKFGRLKIISTFALFGRRYIYKNEHLYKMLKTESKMNSKYEQLIQIDKRMRVSKGSPKTI